MNVQSNRITEHAILGAETQSDFVEILFEGKALKAKKDEPVMAALVAAGGGRCGSQAVLLPLSAAIP